MPRNNLYIADLLLDDISVQKCERRRFHSVDKMRRYIQFQWNSVVTPDDHVWIIGDVCVYPDEKIKVFVESLHGHKHLIVGEHDDVGRLRRWNIFETIHTMRYIQDTPCPVALSYYPLESWEGKTNGVAHIHGHVRLNQWDVCTLPNRYNATCSELDYIPRPLDYFIIRDGYNADFYKGAQSQWLHMHPEFRVAHHAVAPRQADKRGVNFDAH